MVDNTALNIQTDLLSEIPSLQDDIKWCSVKLSEILEKGKRIEASVFGLDGRHARELLFDCKHELKNLTGAEGIATAYHRPRFKRVWVEKSGFPIFQPSSILDIFPTPDGYVSERTNTDLEQLRVKEGQILLTCSGTVGKATIVSETLANKIFSHDLIRITCKDKDDIGFVYAYLKTKIGNMILQTNNYGSVVTHIEPEHLDHVPIPYPNIIRRREINNLVLESFKLRDESNELIKSAQDLLIDELKLPSLDNLQVDRLSDAVEAYSVKLSNLDNRIDGSFHVPLVNSIVKHISKNSEEIKFVKDNSVSKKVILPGRFKRIYVEEGNGRVFFGGKQLYELDPSNKKYLSLTHHGDRIKEQLELKENMILITCSGTIGKVSLVPKHWENWTANQHIIRIVPSDLNIAGYLYVFLSTEYGRVLINRFTYGSVVDEITDKHVGNIPIPILKNAESQKRINDLALAANEKRFNAFKLEQEAISKIKSIIHEK